MQQTVLTTREVAKALGVHVRTVHRMAEDGRLSPTVRVPGYKGPLLFDPADVEALKGEDA